MVSALLRSAALFLSFASGVTGMFLGIHAMVESNAQKASIQKSTPAAITVKIDSNQIILPGTLVTIGCSQLAIASLLTFLVPFCRPRASKFPARTTRLRLLPPFIHFFSAVCIMASLIALDVIASNGEIKVQAFLGDTQLPESIVSLQQQMLGISSKYWDFSFIKLLAIVPWTAFLFGMIAGVVLLRSSKDSVPIAVVNTNEGASAMRVDLREADESDTASVKKAIIV